jgi:predicted O-methyltransferase YrrM
MSEWHRTLETLDIHSHTARVQQIALCHAYEQELLRRLCRGERPLGAVELGTWLGGTTVLLAKVAQEYQTFVLGIDHHRGDEDLGPQQTEAQYLANIARYGVADTVISLVARTEHLKGRLQAFAPGSCCFAFIDGAHDAPHVLADALIAGHLVQEGLICWHDFDDNRDVKRVYAEVSGPLGLRPIEQVECLLITRRDP